jgi:hypothetical protein
MYLLCASVQLQWHSVQRSETRATPCCTVLITCQRVITLSASVDVTHQMHVQSCIAQELCNAQHNGYNAATLTMQVAPLTSNSSAARTISTAQLSVSATDSSVPVQNCKQHALSLIHSSTTTQVILLYNFNMQVFVALFTTSL